MKRYVGIILRWLRNLVVLFFLSTLLAVVVYRFLPVYITPLMVILPRAYPTAAIRRTHSIKNEMPETGSTPPNKFMSFTSIFYFVFLV